MTQIDLRNNDMGKLNSYFLAFCDRKYTANLVNVTQKRKRWIRMTQKDLEYDDKESWYSISYYFYVYKCVYAN